MQEVALDSITPSSCGSTPSFRGAPPFFFETSEEGEVPLERPWWGQRLLQGDCN